MAANTPLGLLYAARTLDQLVPVPEASSLRIEFPWVSIVDWPDFSERGEWGGNAAQDLDWLAKRKLNVVEVHPRLGFDDSGAPTADLDPDMLNEASRVGVKIVPIILHLEQLAGTGLFKYHPEVAATPDPSKPLPTDYTPGVCFSNPETVDLLAGWMRRLLDIPGVTEIDVWLSEMEGGCFCPKCLGQNPFVLETQGIQKAFEKVRAGHPRAGLRILLTQASYDSNDKVLASVAPYAKVIYYDGGRTYDSSHRPMIYQLLENYAWTRWLGVYPQLTNSWRTVFPFSGPQFILAREQEFFSKHLKSVIGYATPSNRYYEFNVTAAAEWGWSNKGRSVAEFAEAFATSKEIPEPAKYAAWVQKLGEVGWRLAGSRSIEGLVFGAGGLTPSDSGLEPGPFADTLKSLKYGAGLLSEFADEKVFSESLSQARAAQKLAAEIGDRGVTAESDCVVAALELLGALGETSVLSQPGQRPAGDALKQALENLDDAAHRLTASLYRWGMRANPVSRANLPSRFRDTVDAAASAADQVWRLASRAGITDPRPEYRRRPVLRWSDKDFAAGESASLWADVSGLLTGPGEYDVILQFLSGAAGVSTRAVSLLRGETRDKAEVIDADAWDFQVGRWNNYVDYWLTLSPESAAGAKPGDHYFLKVDLGGPALSLPAARRTTSGFAALRRSWRQ